MSKVTGVSSIQEVKPEGSILESPAEALQKDLDENLGRPVQSNVLQSIIESSPEPASQDLSEYDQMMQEEPEQLPVDEEINETLKLGQAPSLRVEAKDMATQAAESEQFQTIFEEADKDLYTRGELRRQQRGMNRDTDRYNFQGGKRKAHLTSNGGIFDRSENFANVLLNAENPIGLVGFLHTQPTFENQIDPRSKVSKTLIGLNATTKDQKSGAQIINPEFLRLASLVTEDVFADQTMGEKRKEDQERERAGADFTDNLPIEERPSFTISKMQRNKELGDRLLKEWNTLTGADTSSADSNTKVLLGDMMKELYYEVNKGPSEAPLINRHVYDRTKDIDGKPQKEKEVIYEVTALGQQMFRESEAIRKLYFPKEHVDALDASRSSGDIRVSGALKNVHLDAHQEIIEAIKTLESIPHFVIPRREKILLATLLPALAQGNASPEIIEMSKAINGFGKGKMAEFFAREKIAKLDGQEFDALANMEILKRNIAQSLLGIAKHRGKSVYLTYFVQAFNGRLTAEQSHFNPQTSKQVRFVTGNPEKASFIPGKNSKLEKNLREMYAMMILKLNNVDAGDTLTAERMRMFDEGYSSLVEFGKSLKESLDNTTIDVDAISDAITKGIPLDSPDFPKFQGLQIDPSKAKLIEAITKKGEDGLALIDGLIDLYEYDQVLQYNKKNPNNPRQFRTHYNAYIDGKTNGLAINGLQLGNEPIALRTGVIRSDASIYAVEDNKDLRDALAETLTNTLHSKNAFPPGTFKKYGFGNGTSFIAIAHALFNTRNLNKGTTMTFGYGKELESFKKDLRDYLVLNYEESKQLNQELQGMDPSSLSDKDIAKMQLANHYDALQANFDSYYKGKKSLYDFLIIDLFDMYMDKMVEVITPDGIQARKMMYNFAMFHVMMDEVFELETPTGMPIFLGGTEIIRSDDPYRRDYGILTDDPSFEPLTRKVNGEEVVVEGQYKRKAAAIKYATRPTAAAIRSGPVNPWDMQVDDNGRPLGYTGGAAVGGSNPSSIQSVDAAVVARTFSGKSAEKLRKASPTGKVYGLQIYDAFKSDVHNFDVINFEVNQNFLNINKEFFYLDIAHQKMKKAMDAFIKKTIGSKNSDEKVSIGRSSGYRKIGEFLESKSVYDPEVDKSIVIYPALELFFKRNLNMYNAQNKLKSKDELTKEARFVTTNFIKTLREEGVDLSESYAQMKKKDIYKFVVELSNATGFKDRTKFIYGKILPQRNALFSKIDSEQRKDKMVAQYHAH